VDSNEEPQNVRYGQRKSSITKTLKYGQRRRKTSRKRREEIWGGKGHSRHHVKHYNKDKN
jgi:hypothetical protein